MHWNDLSNKVCISNKKEDLNLSLFNMIKRTNVSNVLTKHISCECKCKLNRMKCNSSQWRKIDKCRSSVKSIIHVKKDMFGILVHPGNIKIDEKSYKDILIYYIEYVTIKEYVKIYGVNPLYLIFRNVNGCFEEIDKSKYLRLVPTNESKEKNRKI